MYWQQIDDAMNKHQICNVVGQTKAKHTHVFADRFQLEKKFLCSTEQ